MDNDIASTVWFTLRSIHPSAAPARGN